MNLSNNDKIRLARLAGLTIDHEKYIHISKHSYVDLDNFICTDDIVNWNDIQLIKEGIREKGFDYYIESNCQDSNLFIFIITDGFGVYINGLVGRDLFKTESEAILTAALKLCDHLNIIRNP